MRPPRKDRDEGDMIVEKLSSDSLTINGQTFTFDSVADPEATQAKYKSRYNFEGCLGSGKLFCIESSNF